MIEQIAAQLHLAPEMAAELVAEAQGNGRDAVYLDDLLAYVRDTPSVDNPVAMFQRLVKSNAVRQRAAPPQP